MPRKKRRAVASSNNGNVAKRSVAKPKDPPKSCFKLSGLAAVREAYKCFFQRAEYRKKTIKKNLDKARYLQDILSKMKPPRKKKSKLLREVREPMPMQLSPRTSVL